MRWLRDFLRDFTSEGGTVVVSSHHLAEIAQTVDRVVIIDHGRLVAEAPLDELTTLLLAGGRVPRPDGGFAGVIDQLRSELLKLRTTPTLAVLLLAAAVLTVLGAGSSGAVLLATFAGLLAVTSEFRHGTIRPTLLVQPRRSVVLAAKLAGAALAGLVLAIVCEFVSRPG